MKANLILKEYIVNIRISFNNLLKFGGDFMIYNIVLANPANNITIIVLDCIDKENYSDIANRILKNSKFGAEQVGFVKKPIMDGKLRLEMMGGEFCGNALRSFGMMVAKNNEIEKGVVTVEISGSDKSLNVEVDNINKSAKAEVPLPKEIEYVRIDELLEFPVVMFDGIYHAIVEGIEANEENFSYIKNSIMKRYNIEALGIMFFDRERYFITPVVYVRDTDTTVFENSCGSGTIATALYLSDGCTDSVFKCSINQPGGVIDSEIYKSEGRVTKLVIGGKVELSEVIKIEI